MPGCQRNAFYVLVSSIGATAFGGQLHVCQLGVKVDLKTGAGRDATGRLVDESEQRLPSWAGGHHLEPDVLQPHDTFVYIPSWMFPTSGLTWRATAAR